jgi:hypothetical protein
MAPLATQATGLLCAIDADRICSAVRISMLSGRFHCFVKKAVVGIGLIIAAPIAFILVLALNHRRPNAKVPLSVGGKAQPGPWPDRLNLLTWNLGYAGTGEEADLFMEGGRDVLAKDRTTVITHIQNMIAVLQQQPEDIYLLQEVDLESRRAFYVNELGLITSRLTNFYYSFAPNYDVWFVPYP